MRTRAPRRPIVGALAGVVLAATTSTVVLAAPPTMSELNEKMQAFGQWYRGLESTERTRDAMGAKVEELFADYAIDEFTLELLQGSMNYLTMSESLGAQANARLAALAAEPTVDGARAAIMQVTSQRTRDAAKQAEMARTILEHPGTAKMIETGQAGELFAALSRMMPEALAKMPGEVLGLERAIDGDMEPAAMSSLVSYVEAVRGLPADVAGEAPERIRAKVAKKIAGALAAMKAAEGEPDQRTMDMLESRLAYVDGAYMRGELMDHPMPAVNIEWSSNPAITSMADLKGKVVVLDFWATWCGPCKSSFPNVAKLQERYAGYDVAIVGVTSLQGRHYPKSGGPVDCTGDPQKEYGLMPEFMEEYGMTWNVIFTSESCFNPDFGVRGIPHLAIVDADGVVRHRGMHPANPLPEKASKIDALLVEAGLPTPPAIDGEKPAGVGG